MVRDPDRWSLSRRSYRVLDAGTKLGGVCLLAAGLDAGLATTTGALLGLAGASLATITVSLDHHD
ncbi:MAG: hypothetical protein ABEJ06_02175 [Haloarculaceae archaeon]